MRARTIHLWLLLLTLVASCLAAPALAQDPDFDAPRVSEAPQVEDDWFPVDQSRPEDEVAPNDAIRWESAPASRVQPVEPDRPKLDNLFEPMTAFTQVNKSGVSAQVLKRPQGEGAVQGLGVTFTPNLQTGSASTGIPLALPPARAGFAPSLGLSYSTGGGHGLAGMGWNFGVGFIARQTDQGLPTYDDAKDRFVYAGGTELVRVQPTGAMPPWFDSSRDYYYRSKLEGTYFRVFLLYPGTSNSTWVAQEPGGTIHYFGQVPGEARNTESLVCNSTCTQVFRWNLRMSRDVHGNIIRYDYTKDQGQPYLWRVRYNVHPTDSTRFQHHVEFQYETRADALTNYQAGYAVTTGRRLSRVIVSTDTGAARRTVRTYELTYQSGLFHSLLASVRVVGSNGSTALPPVTFDYTTVPDGVSTTTMGLVSATLTPLPYSPDDTLGDGRRDLLDVNADGLPDVYETDPLVGLNSSWLENFGGDTGFYEGSRRTVTGSNGLMLSNSNVHLMDVDGDGRVDLIHMPMTGYYHVYTSTCTVAGVCTWVYSYRAAVNPAIDFTTDAENLRFFDVDGDHRTDVVRTTGTRMEYYYNLGKYTNGVGRFGQYLGGALSNTPATSCLLHKGVPIQFSDPRVKIADMNGDGLQDIVVVDTGVVAYWPNRGHGHWGTNEGTCTSGYQSTGYITMTGAPFHVGYDANRVQLGDVNGDGIGDYVYIRETSVDIYLGTSTGFLPRVIVPAPFSAPFTAYVRLADVNGNGTQDILWADGGNYRYIDLSGGVRPRVLSQFDNGLGGRTRITYTSSVDQYLAARAAGQPWRTTCPFPQQVVASTVTEDLSAAGGYTAPPRTTRYTYRDCYYDGQEHEFRGFAQTTEEQVGDAHTPSQFVTHQYYQGKTDEAGGLGDEILAGMEYRTEVSDASGNVLSTQLKHYALRTLMAAHPADMAPGLDPTLFLRHVRMVYPKTVHAFGYDLHAVRQDTNRTLTVLQREDAGGTVTELATATFVLPYGTAHTTHVVQEIARMSNFGQPEEAVAYGSPEDNDAVRRQHARFALDEASWLFRVCETWVTQDHDPRVYNHLLHHYDGLTSAWGAQPGQAVCPLGTRGLSTKGEYRVETPGVGTRTVEAHKTRFDTWGQPVHTQVVKKQEEWLFYEDSSYRGIATREVVRVGTQAAQLSGTGGGGPGSYDNLIYPETAVKFLTMRAQVDPGLGVVTQFEEPDGTKTQAVYDSLGRLSAVWGAHAPRSGCETPQLPSVALEYDLASSSRRYNVLRTTVYEDRCDPNQAKRSVAFVDGLGRTLLMCTQGPEASGPRRTICAGAHVVSARGLTVAAYTPSYVDFDLDAPLASLRLPAFPQVNCPTDPTTPITDAHVCVSRQSYDAFGRKTMTTAPDGTRSELRYFGPRRVRIFDDQDLDPASVHADTPREVETDGHGQIVQVVETYRGGENNAELRTERTSYAWDALGNLVQLRRHGSASDGSGDIIKTQFYDTIGQKVQIDDFNAGTWTFGYDDAGNLAWHQDPRGNRFVFGYDDGNRLIWEDCVSGPTCGPEVEVRYHYDSPATWENGEGFFPAGIVDHDGIEIPQTHVLGRLAWVEDRGRRTYTSYNARGEVVAQAKNLHGFAMLPDANAPEVLTPMLVGDAELFYVSTRELDDVGRVRHETLVDGTELNYTYDRRGLLATLSGVYQDRALTFVQAVTYDLQGRRVAARLGGGIRETKTYNQMGRTLEVLRVLVDETETTTAEVLHLAYTYDRVGRLTSQTDLRADGLRLDGTSAPTVKTYTYDGQGQLLTSEERTVADDILVRRMRYDYDVLGNIVEKHTTRCMETTSPCTEQDDPPDEYYTHWFGTATYHGDQLVSADGGDGNMLVATYDLAGNMETLAVTRGGQPYFTHTYTWDEQNRLASAVGTGQLFHGGQGVVAVAGYAYDNGGARIAALRAKTFVGVELEETLYVDPSFEIRNGEYTTYVHDAKGRLARLISHGPAAPPDITWLHADHLGSTTVVTSDDGTFIEETKYLPYGAVQSTHRPDLGIPYEPYGFTGKEPERDFGILYFGARYYNPHLARWISPDPLFLHVTSESAEKSQNVYCYVDNNPVLFTDKYGFVPDGDTQVRTEKAIAKSRGYTYDEYQRRKYNQSVKALPYIGAAVGATVLLVYTTYVVIPKIVLFAAPLLQQTAQRCQPVLDKTNKVVSPANRPVSPAIEGTQKLLPAARQIEAAWGASTYRHGGLMTGIEHIMYRHSAGSGFPNVSHFAQGTSARNIMGYVDEALRYGTVTQTGPGAFTVEHALGRTIGTNIAGDAAGSIRVLVRDGIIQSAFPF